MYGLFRSQRFAGSYRGKYTPSLKRIREHLTKSEYLWVRTYSDELKIKVKVLKITRRQVHVLCGEDILVLKYDQQEQQYYDKNEMYFWNIPNFYNL